MGRSAKTAFATLPPEELLLDYARRLGRHRRGRRAVQLRLSRLTRAYRHPQDLRAAEGPFRTLLERHEGELFGLGSGDLVCCAKAPRSAFDAAVLRVLYMMRDDAHLRAAIDRGQEDAFLCRWFDLDRDYEAFLGFAEGVAAEGAGDSAATAPLAQPETRSQAEAVAAPAAEPEGPAAEPGAAAILSDRSSAQETRRPETGPPRRLSADEYARLERALATADLSRFLARRPVTAIGREGIGEPAMERIGIDLGRLGRAVMPGTDLAAEPWFHRRLATLLASRLVSADLPRPDDGVRGCLLEATTEAVFTRPFERFLLRTGAQMRRRLILAFAAEDVFADPERYLRAHGRLSECGLAAAITGLDPLRFTMREEESLPAAYDGVSWPLLRIGEGGASETAIGRFVRALRRRDPGRVILEDCDGPLAVEFGRDLGIRLYAGPHAETAVAER